MNESPTFRLFKYRQSLLSGAGSILDFSDPLTKYNASQTGVEADCMSIGADWLAVGGDMRSAIQQYEQEATQ